MDKISREKLYNRITYLLFACLLIVTMFFPMFTIKNVVGTYSEEEASSVSALQIMKVGLKSEEQLIKDKISLSLDVEEIKDAWKKEGKTDEQIEKALKTNSTYNELILIDVHMQDMSVLKPMAITMVVLYSLIGALALLFVLSMILNKDVLDVIGMFTTAAVAVVGIVVLVLSFGLTVKINASQSLLICGELMMYFATVAPVIFAVIQVIEYFVARRKRKISESEIIKPFTGTVEE